MKFKGLKILFCIVKTNKMKLKGLKILSCIVKTNKNIVKNQTFFTEFCHNYLKNVF